VNSGKIDAEDIVAETHCMHPNFLENQLELSLKNMGLETLDLYYLHNSAECQLALLGDDKYYDSLARVFEFFEEKVLQGKIKNYGMATYNCFRSPPEEKGICLSLQKCVEMAEKVAGDSNHFNYVQMPINTVHFETVFQEWQYVNSELVFEDFV
jgi:predicted aldo/keto reductase-like oxidoreductase